MINPATFILMVIIGATVGSTTIKISGTGGDCTSISADIPVAVV